ncbi:MAG: hypothetical protein WCI39_05865 [Gallionellaceae bacterium]
MFLNRVFAVTLLVLSPAALADSLDINMNNNAAAFKYGATADFVQGNAELQTGLLYNDVNNMFFEAGLMVKGGGEENAPGLSIGVGAKGVFGTIPATAATNNSSINGSAIAVGGSVTLAFPTESRVAIVGEYFASPKIMSFADAERFNQFGLRLEVGVSPQANVYVGYREIGFGVKTLGGVVLDKGTHMGVSILF